MSEGRSPSPDDWVPPYRATIEGWRIALEAAACGSVENVWPLLSDVIADIRDCLGMTAPAIPVSRDEISARSPSPPVTQAGPDCWPSHDR